MIVGGELINASRSAIGDAIEMQDNDPIKKVAKDQFEAGANYIDVNAGVLVGKELTFQGDKYSLFAAGS